MKTPMEDSSGAKAQMKPLGDQTTTKASEAPFKSAAGATESKHTPGPNDALARSYANELTRTHWRTGWRLREGPTSAIVIKDADGRTVASVPLDHSVDPHDQDRARLIAAAPELLAALAEVVADLQFSEVQQHKNLVVIARAAIKKAKGAA